MTAADEPTPPSLLERAIDARSEADRARLLRELTDLNPEQRTAAVSLLAEIEQIRTGLPGRPIPEKLEQSLLNIPLNNPLDIPRSTPKPRFNWREIANQPIGWQHLAACLVIAVCVAAYFTWHGEPAAPRPLDRQMAVQVGAMVLRSEATAATMNGATDQKSLLASWRGIPMAFTPQILQPRVPLQFAGGGTVSFNGTPAVFTRWTAGRARYTVYQFEGQCLGLPAMFLTTNTDSQQPNTRVMLWPGADGKCDWALVAIDAPVGNPFIGTY